MSQIGRLNRVPHGGRMGGERIPPDWPPRCLRPPRVRTAETGPFGRANYAVWNTLRVRWLAACVGQPVAMLRNAPQHAHAPLSTPQRCMHVRWVLRSVVRAGEGGLGTGSGESRCAWATMRAPCTEMPHLSTSWTTWSIQRYRSIRVPKSISWFYGVGA
jgi:hypothetical protein